MRVHARSEAIRDALRDWSNLLPKLSAEILDDLGASRKKRERSETASAGKARERLGLDGEE